MVKKNVYKKREDGKNDTGRPAFYKTPEELQAKIDEYFKTQCKTVPILDSEGKPLMTTKGFPVVELNPPTMAGLALYLGFTNRTSLYEYSWKGNFSDTIKKAISRVEEYAEKQLTSGSATGAIFWLKNHGWADTTKQELTGADGGAIELSHTVDMKKIKELNEMLDG